MRSLRALLTALFLVALAAPAFGQDGDERGFESQLATETTELENYEPEPDLDTRRERLVVGADRQLEPLRIRCRRTAEAVVVPGDEPEPLAVALERKLVVCQRDDRCLSAHRARDAGPALGGINRRPRRQERLGRARPAPQGDGDRGPDYRP